MKVIDKTSGIGLEIGQSTIKTKTLSPELLHKIDAYWRAANYLSVGQIYLYDNPRGGTVSEKASFTASQPYAPRRDDISSHDLIATATTMESL